VAEAETKFFSKLLGEYETVRSEVVTYSKNQNVSVLSSPLQISSDAGRITM
jgi:hypothetical protein